MTPFLVQLDAFHGPLDLLLYLVRKQELEPCELSLSRVTQQYLDYVELLEAIDADAVGDFLEIASTLLEIKSQRVLPAEGEPEEAIEEPRQELVGRLLEYRRYRDAAHRLEARGLDWLRRSERIAERSAAPRATDPADQPLEGVELWDLVSAFARVMRQRKPTEERVQRIVYDETPVHVHMQRVDAALRAAEAEVPFPDLFPSGPVHKSTLIGLFLAVLELVRHRHALATQRERFGEILLAPGPVPLPADYGAAPAAPQAAPATEG